MIQFNPASGSRVASDLFDRRKPVDLSANRAVAPLVQDHIELARGPGASLAFERIGQVDALAIDFGRFVADPKQALAGSPGFQQLPPAIRDRMLNDVGHAPELLSSMQRMAGSESFRGLPETTQDWAVYELSKHRDPRRLPGREPIHTFPALGPANARKTITDLATLPGLASLGPEEQLKLVRVVGGSNPLSDRARQALGGQLLGLQITDAATAAGQLRTFLRDQAYLPDGARDVFPPRGPAVPFTVSAGVDVTAGVGKDEAPAAAKRYDVTVGGRTIRVTIAEPPPANSPTADTVARSLAVQTPQALQFTKDVFISADTTRGGGANGGNGKIIVFPGFSDQNDLDRLMSHEAAHMFSDVMVGDWTSDNRWNDWQSRHRRRRPVPLRLRPPHLARRRPRPLWTAQPLRGLRRDPADLLERQGHPQGDRAARADAGPLRHARPPGPVRQPEERDRQHRHRLTRRNVTSCGRRSGARDTFRSPWLLPSKDFRVTICARR